jgi:hypothetical protein
MSGWRDILADDDSHSQEPNLGTVFDQYIKHEFQDHDVDVDATMETMTKEPYGALCSSCSRDDWRYRV